MNCESNPWGEATTCGAKGVCVMLSPQLGYCNCSQGFTHDLIFGRYRDCTLPATSPGVGSALDVALIVSSLILFGFALLYARSALADARRLLLLNAAAVFALMVCCVVHFVDGGRSTSAHLYLIVLWMSISFLMVRLAIYVMISPLYSFAKKDTKFFTRFLQYSFIFFRIVDIATVSGFQQYSDFTVLENDVPWNNGVQVFVFVLGIEVCIINFIIVFEADKLVKVIREISENLSGNVSSSSNGMAVYIRKVQRVRQMIIIAMPGFIPYDWVIYYLSFLAYVLGTIEYLRFGRRESQVPTRSTGATSGAPNSPDAGAVVAPKNMNTTLPSGTEHSSISPLPP